MSFNSAGLPPSIGGVGSLPASGLDEYTLRTSLYRNLSTGNMIVDAVVMTFIMSLIQTIFSYLQTNKLSETLQKWWIKWFCPEKPEPIYNSVRIRTVDYRALITASAASSLNRGEFGANNTILVTAFYWYLNKQRAALEECDIAIQFDETRSHTDERFRTHSTFMRPLREVRIDKHFLITTAAFREEDGSGAQAPQKKSRSSTATNGEENATAVDSHQILYGKDLLIRSTRSVADIHSFIVTVWETYCNAEYPLQVRNTRVEKWYFVKESRTSNKYHEFILTSRINFDDVFFPRKAQIIKKINEFMEERTKISRFSLLLHGPPGGGKTSFVKALHHVTQSSVIVVKLSQFTDVKDLITLFHHPWIDVADTNNDKSRLRYVPINRRIYLFEDIDAEDKIVLKRKNTKETETVAKSDADKKAEKEKAEKEDKDKKEKKDKRAERKIQHKLFGKRKTDKDNDKDSSDNSSDSDSEGEEAQPMSWGSDSEDEFPTHASWFHWRKGAKFGGAKSTAAIKLADVLNLLDGVLELNGCFIVLTTNYLEKLDPALIRDGRITYRIELGQITLENMKAMIHKFFPTYDPLKGHSDIDLWLPQLKPMMPCQFEQLVQHELTLEDLIPNLQKAAS